MRVGEGRKKSSGHRQVSCLARVGQAASVQAWENIGVGLEYRQPPGRPSCFSRLPPPPFPGSQPERSLQLTPKSGRIRNVEVGPKGLVAHSPPITHTQHQNASCGEEGVHPRAKPGGKAWCGVGVAPRLLGRTRPQGRGAALIQPCPGSRPLGLASQSPRLGSPGPTGRMGTEASFLPMLCL